MSRVVALCGGVGGAKLAFGLAKLLAPEDLTLIVNTGDDFEHLGLTICPDLDTVTYTLAGLENPDTGWGRAGETWGVLQELARRGGESWFRLGDKDIAHHLTRRALLDAGRTLTAATASLTTALGVLPAVVPMANESVRTIIETEDGALAFQDYFVRRRCEPRVTGFRFEGADRACLPAEASAALEAPDLAGIILCPSNPFVSLGPMLAVPGLRESIEACSAPVIAVSPIVGGQALKGPAAKMMAELGYDVSVVGVASFYEGLIDALVIDTMDKALGESVAMKRASCFVTNTIMSNADERIALARQCLRFLDLMRD